MDAVDVTDEVVAGVENLLRFLDDVVLGVIFVLDRFVPEDEEANEDNEDTGRSERANECSVLVRFRPSDRQRLRSVSSTTSV